MRRFLLILAAMLGVSVTAAVCGEVGTVPQGGGELVAPSDEISQKAKETAKAIMGDKEISWYKEGIQLYFDGRYIYIMDNGMYTAIIKPGDSRLYHHMQKNKVIGRVDDVIPVENREAFMREQLTDETYEKWISMPSE